MMKKNLTTGISEVLIVDINCSTILLILIVGRIAMNLWEGAWDLHVHSAPDVIGRKVTDHELMQRLIACGMKRYAIKSHISSTTGRAKLMNEIHPQAIAVGTITLNNAVGGINPFAVELAAMDGA